MHSSAHSYTNQCIKHVLCQTPDTADQFTSQPVATRRATLLITHSSLPLLQRGTLDIHVESRPRCFCCIPSGVILGTCKASRFDSNSNRTSRFDSKVTGRFENFESPCLPRLPSYHKQHSLFNDKFQSFRHCYWDLY